MAAKVAPVLPHAAIGAALGAGVGLGESQMSNEPMRQKIEELEAKPERGLRDTMDLAQARARHTLGTYAEEHPGVSTGMGALTGAMFGATAGPGIVAKAQKIPGVARDVGKNIKDFGDLFRRGAA
jgi:hypothetical protein